MKTEYDGMKILSTVLREEKITKRGEILEFVKGAELITLQGRKKVPTTDVRFGYNDSNSDLRFSGQQHWPSELLVVSGGGRTIEDFGKQISELDGKILEIEGKKEEIKKKIQWMNQTRSDKFNEREFKAYTIIQTINQRNLNDHEKAKLIAEHIK